MSNHKINHGEQNVTLTFMVGVDFGIHTYLSNTWEQNVTLIIKVKGEGHNAMCLNQHNLAKYCL